MSAIGKFIPKSGAECRIYYKRIDISLYQIIGRFRALLINYPS
ncbi:hypothetical protein B224_4775 [Aeromonas media WS]|nr:hypothetical protein B224_4775 [Aeromonas media WS]